MYDDIIDYKFDLKFHNRMSLEDRCAIFMPFSALTGYKENIDEKNIIYDKKIELSDEKKEIINKRLLEINKLKYPNVYIKYFIEYFKNNFKYINKYGVVKKIDLYNNVIVFEDNTKIKINNIVDIYF